MSSQQELFEANYYLFEKRFLQTQRAWVKSRHLANEFKAVQLMEQEDDAERMAAEEAAACNRIIDFQLGLLNELEWQRAWDDMNKLTKD